MSDKKIEKVSVPDTGVMATIADVIGYGRDYDHQIKTTSSDGSVTVASYGNQKTERDEDYSKLLKK